MKSYERIKGLHTIAWRSLLSLSASQFEKVLDDTSVSSTFNSEFAENIGQRYRELERTHFRLYLVFIPFVSLLGGINGEIIQEVTILGVTLSKDNNTLSFLLLISAILIFIISISSIMADYYSGLLEAYVKKHYDEKVVKFHLSQFRWSINSPVTWTSDYGQIKSSPFSFFVIGVWSVSLVYTAILVQIMILFVFIGAILSVHNDPTLPLLPKVSIVVVAACAIVFDIFCLLLRIPLPLRDYSNLIEMERLEADDPDLSETVHKNIAARDLTLERRKSISLQAIILILSIFSTKYYFLGSGLFLGYEVFYHMLFAFVFMFMVVTPLINGIENRFILSIAKIEDDSLKVRRYTIRKSQILWGRLLTAAIVGLGVTLYFH